ncbi:Proteinaceous RNase P 1, chloroplastic/mitochondrial [Vitis vinifera]|uniref:Proteinaceous RNase P 1, chloroplastic/mitochondrial n=1 Tax=Vitis vinifera TaxID=29760 RepID=A0A438ICF5_VITVI|nr:Proteinaceous RNase P 1, chloroplastic/mitochondrial [Vitis vinifera]
MLTRAGGLSFFFAKAPILCHVGHTRLRPLLYGCSHHHFKPTTYSPYIKDRIFTNKSAHFLNVALSATNKYIPESSAAAKTMSNKTRKKARRESPEGVLRFKTDMCSKHGDVVEALHLYDEARSRGVPLSQHNYNVLLYLCSCSGSNGDENVVNLALKRGFEIFKQMGVDGIEPNEATFTSATRLACAMEDPEMAFNLVKQMKSCGIPPKLRSYGPPLFRFCKKGDADRAYEVDAHMVESGVVAEEPELCALLGLSVESRWVDQVHEMMHHLRASVRQVSESTAEVVERWFNSEDAARVGEENWDVGKVREGVVKGGGGWHGQGWLGKGK